MAVCISIVLSGQEAAVTAPNVCDIVAAGVRHLAMGGKGTTPSEGPHNGALGLTLKSACCVLAPKVSPLACWLAPGPANIGSSCAGSQSVLDATASSYGSARRPCAGSTAGRRRLDLSSSCLVSGCPLGRYPHSSSFCTYAAHQCSISHWSVDFGKAAWPCSIALPLQSYNSPTPTWYNCPPCASMRHFLEYTTMWGRSASWKSTSRLSRFVPCQGVEPCARMTRTLP